MVLNLANTIMTGGLFLAYGALWHAKRLEVFRSENVNVNVLSKSIKPVQRFFGFLERVMTLTMIALIALHLFFKDAFPFFSYLDLLDTSAFKIIGFTLGICGLILCRIAQVTMGNSWRVGIDERSMPGLITHGIYKFIRNPTYTGLFILVVGVLMINPTVLYSYWALSFFIIMEFQVRCEEEYLGSLYNDKYHEYCQRTKRYIPLIY